VTPNHCAASIAVNGVHRHPCVPDDIWLRSATSIVRPPRFPTH